MKKIRRILPLFLALFPAAAVCASGAELVPVGEAVGIVLDVKGVYVEEIMAFQGENGRVSPAEKAVPHTPRPGRISMQAGFPWKGPRTSRSFSKR